MSARRAWRLNRPTAVFGVHQPILSEHLATHRVEQIQHFRAVWCHEGAVDVKSV
jgi:hypothetical protein